MQIRKTCAAILLSGRALEQRVQAVPDHAIDHEGAARVRHLAEEQLSSPVSVDIDRVNQFKSGENIQMLRVGQVRQRFVKVAVHILASH